MKKVPLTNSGGMAALVDDEDFIRVIQFNWFRAKRGQRVYAQRNAPKGEPTLLHRFILRATFKDDVHHDSGIGLDCQKKNLIRATRKNNLRAFRIKSPSATSKFRGVSWSDFRKKWCAYITVDYKNMGLGRFTTEEVAARAYDAAARKYFGEFACPNFK